jgi:hypothetical protein
VALAAAAAHLAQSTWRDTNPISLLGTSIASSESSAPLSTAGETEDAAAEAAEAAAAAAAAGVERDLGQRILQRAALSISLRDSF